MKSNLRTSEVQIAILKVAIQSDIVKMKVFLKKVKYPRETIYAIVNAYVKIGWLKYLEKEYNGKKGRPAHFYGITEMGKLQLKKMETEMNQNENE